MHEHFSSEKENPEQKKMMKLKEREIIIIKILQTSWDGTREGGGINLSFIP